MLKRILSLLLLFPLMAQAANYSKELSLMLEWFVNPDHGPIIIAEQNGYFKEQNLKVTIQEPAEPTLPPKMVASGNVDLAIYYQQSLTRDVDTGLPLAWAGTLVATPLNGITVLDESPIKSIKDLKGKTIGMAISGNETATFNAMFKPHDFTADDVKLINVGWNLSSSLLSGRVDAITGGYRNFELNQLEIEGKKGRMFYNEEHGIPPYDQLIYIANSRKHDKEAIRRFMEAVEKGTQFIVNNPDKSWELFRDYRKEQLDNELNRRAWYDTVPRFALRPAARDVGRYQRYSDFLKKHGDVKNPPRASEYMLELLIKD